MAEDKRPDSDVVSLTWTLATEDIRFFKEQQYSVTNYGLALLGALVAIRSQFSTAAGQAWFYRGCYLLMVLAIVILSVRQILLLQFALERQRTFKDGARDYLRASSRPLNEILARQQKTTGWRSRWRDTKTTGDGDVYIILTAVVAAAAVVAASVLFLTIRS
jgi:hypothetical protein